MVMGLFISFIFMTVNDYGQISFRFIVVAVVIGKSLQSSEVVVSCGVWPALWREIKLIKVA